ncbi:predicted protein [Micromonas commoda]|uniref:Uncharacterized protein n=1 Tax=Micromonas commoda (strain RCC299 / NOUM17 / CCMP2709) TaxID=296587 RepID=C1DZC4_MICCC|nr:predicted protein [Micromonas commoda]ACO61579.1 predicted protein [Micromonas commoda]|eukprot:XP_002500321.1 predicted protein [Micromonas commoda]
MAGLGPVRVRQNLDAMDGIANGDDATARWVWPGARATAKWLCDRRAEWIEGMHVVEIGSGTGLLGLVAARLGAASVTLTDLPSELPLLRANARANPSPCPVAVEPCAWGDADAVARVGKKDVVLCSDALYQNDEATQLALAETLLGLCEMRKGRIMFAYNFRENLAADRRFFDATDTLFGHPTQHELEEDEDIWLFEYRPSTRC